MSSIAVPAEFKPNLCIFTQMVNDRVGASPFGGSEQAIDLLNDRWLASIQIPPDLPDGGAWVEAYIGSMRGRTNTTPLHHFKRPVPRGTIRGTLTLSADAAQGAASIALTGCSPSTGTLLRGDMLGVGGLLVMVAADCTASGGAVTVSLTNRLRAAQLSGASVTWNKPTANFRLLNSSGVRYIPGQTDPVTFDFGEAI